MSLEKPKQRRTLGLTVVEGLKELEMAMAAGIEFDSYFYVPELADRDTLKNIQKKYPDCASFTMSTDLFAKVSYRESSGGIVAVVKTRTFHPKDLKTGNNPLILIVEGVEKPGNLGAILRTADACAIDAVIACNLPGDIYNPNVIRASLGTVFTVPLAVCSNEEAMDWLRSEKIFTYCSNLHEASNYFEENYTGPVAIVVGTEATGVSQSWIDFADKNVKVPMLGKIDSMNVSVAAAIMLYEARRQRRLK